VLGFGQLLLGRALFSFGLGLALPLDAWELVPRAAGVLSEVLTVRVVDHGCHLRALLFMHVVGILDSDASFLGAAAGSPVAVADAPESTD
jgi:hypothetical protein